MHQFFWYQMSFIYNAFCIEKVSVVDLGFRLTPVYSEFLLLQDLFVI